MSKATLSKEKKQTKGNQLERRLGVYGGKIIRVLEQLPETKSGRHLHDQLLRSGTSVGAHYAEARNAQSNSDFVHKIALAAKEVGESRYWLRVAVHAGLVESDLSAIINEADELIAILVSSLQTARRREDG